jgi:hypothetical protein
VQRQGQPDNTATNDRNLHMANPSPVRLHARYIVSNYARAAEKYP